MKGMWICHVCHENLVFLIWIAELTSSSDPFATRVFKEAVWKQYKRNEGGFVRVMRQQHVVIKWKENEHATCTMKF